MLAVLGITFPIFAMVALGYGMVSRGLVFKPADMKVLGAFVLNVALPALVYNAVSARPVGEVFNLGYMGAYLAGGLATMLIGFLWFSATTGPARRGVAVMGTSCPNSSFVGYPLMLIALPNVAGVVLAMNILVENVVLIPIALVIIEMGKGAGEAHLLKRMGNVLIGVVKRPLVIALILGLLASLSGVHLPEPATRLLQMLASSAAALALFVIGGSLVGIELKGNRALAAQIVAGKLIVFPLMAFLAVLGLAALGIALEGEMRVAVILAAAMPMFTIYSVFAQEVGHEGLASIAQLGATLASFVTLNILLAVLL
jgi:malonate transporter and related proteins